jgi:hypothetical protein
MYNVITVVTNLMHKKGRTRKNCKFVKNTIVMETTFDKLVDALYSLPLLDKQELMKLLEKNIAEERRNEIFKNYQASKEEHRQGSLKFSDDIATPKKML